MPTRYEVESCPDQSWRIVFVRWNQEQAIRDAERLAGQYTYGVRVLSAGKIIWEREGEP